MYRVEAYLTHDKRTNSVREGVTARIFTLTGWNHLLHTNTKRKRVSSFAFLRYTRTTKTLQEEAGAYIFLKNVDPSTTHPSSTCTDTKKEKSQLNEPNTVDTYLTHDKRTNSVREGLGE